MSKSKKTVQKGLSDKEIATKYDTGQDVKKAFDQTLKNLSKTPSASALAKQKK